MYKNDSSSSLNMVYAQICCKSAELHEHTAGNDYQKRATLRLEDAGDVFAAMCCFGICGTNGTNQSTDDAITEIAEITQVQRKVIKNCTVVYDSDRNAVLYNPDGEPGVVAQVSEDGVITTKATGTGPHFVDTDNDSGADQDGRLESKAQEIATAYCTPQDVNPGVNGGFGNVNPFGINPQNIGCVYVIDQGHVSVPVLVYRGQVCIDFTSGSCIQGVKQCTSDGIRDCTTRDLYDNIGTEEVFNNALQNTAVQGVGHPNPYYVRCIKSQEENISTRNKLLVSCVRLDEWLSANAQGQNRLMGYAAHPNGAIAVSVVSATAGTPEDVVMERRRGDPLTAFRASMLGGPLPLMIVTEGRLAGTVRVAPLNTGRLDSTTFQTRVTHNGAVDTDLLADRMARTGCRNVIGVAMQKIAPNAQGDLMLHDGV